MNKLATQLQKKYTLLAIEHPSESYILRALATLFFACLLAYLYFVSATVLNVIAQREAERTALGIEGEIGKLEQQHFELSHMVSEHNAAELGLVPVTATAYVYRPGAVGIASISRNAI